MKRILFGLLFVLYGLGLNGQFAGAQISFGVAAINNSSTSFTNESQAHYGYEIGLEGRLNSGTMFFNPGVHYYSFSLFSQDSPDFFGHEYNMAVIKAKMNLGFIFDISRAFKPRFKFGGTLNLVNDVTDNPKYGISDFSNTFGVLGGVGFDFYAITVDFDYEVGLADGLRNVPDSKFTYMTFAVGLFF